MRFIIAAPFLVLGLAACGSDAEELEEPISQEQIAAEVGELPVPSAGLYRQTTQILEFEVPGASEEDLKKMQEEAALENETQESCLSEEEAAKGYKDLVQDLSEAQEGLTCNFTQFDADGSQLDAKLACDAPMSASAKIAIAGTLEPDATDLIMDMTIGIPFVGDMKMKLAMKSERIGPCP